MAQLMEYADYLSKEIGPRPAGTEEEQQAALYITESFQKDSGFPAQIEEFTCSSNLDGISAVPGIVVIVVAILGMIFPVLGIPAFILAAVAAALYTLEALGNPIVTRSLARGASQNVVAKYQPNPDEQETARGRSRKIVLVAHYDSGKVTPGLVQRVESMQLPLPIGLICIGGVVLAAFFLLLHVFVNAGVGGIIVNILTIISLVVCAYPVARAILYRTAPYNEGANNNATGTAALLEVARRIARGSVSEADLAGNPSSANVRIHGEQAALESGLVPEGAQIRYEAEQLTPPSELGEYSDEERLLAAKAAIASLTGQPVERRVYGSAATKLVNSRAHDTEPAASEVDNRVDAPAQVAPADQRTDVSRETSEAPQMPTVAPEPSVELAARADQRRTLANLEAADEAGGFQNAPSWFVAAQQNAKKPSGATGPIQRSRYAEAIEAAEYEAAERERERQERERLQREAELRAREEAARAAIAASALAAEAEPPAADAVDATEPDLSGAPTAEPATEPTPDVREPIAPSESGDSADSGTEEAPIEFAPIPDFSSTPAFVPYADAHPEDIPPAGDQPVDDAFAASLGSTAAFDPRQLQLDDGAEGTEGVSAQREKAEPRASRRLTNLPSIEGGKPASQTKGADPSRSGVLRKLRADVPSLSGVIRMQEAGEDVSQPPAQPPVLASALSSVPEIGAGSDSVPAANPNPRPSERHPQRAAAAGRDSEATVDVRAVEEERVSTDGAGRGRSRDEQGAVDMPKSRAGGLLSRFRRDKKRDKLKETPQEWLEVDDDFDARSVGRERGSWESFRDDTHEDYGEYDDYDDDSSSGRRWEGGSYSRMRLGRVNTRSGGENDADVPPELVEPEDDQQIADEIEQIYHFRNPLYETEVWFVALGAEVSTHDGARAFLAEHGDELRGAMIIEVESLGAGELCAATDEGRIRTVSASSRVKRYIRAATAATGIAPGNVSLAGSDSAASILQAAGYQVMHLLGVEEGRPALKGSADDVLENVDDLLLDDHVNFLMELLKK